MSLPAGSERTYGNVVCIESMTETKCVTQHCSGDKSSAEIWLSIIASLEFFQDSVRMEVLRLRQRGGVEEKRWSRQTRRIPTATQTMAFAKPNPTIMPTAGNGNFRNPGIRPWQAIARLLKPFFSAGSLIFLDSVVRKPRVTTLYKLLVGEKTLGV